MAAMDIPTQSELLDRIVAFCRLHDLAETRFGRDAVNNPAFIAGLRRDPPVSPTLETLNRLKAYMERKDGEARAAEFCSLPSTPPLSGEQQEQQLPFGPAPVKTTGASSPTSSPTTGRPHVSEASDTSPASSSSDPETQAA